MPVDFQVQYDASQLKAYAERLNPAVLEAKMGNAMAESLELLKGDLQGRPNFPVDTGNARGRLSTQYRGYDGGFEGQVASPDMYLAVMELGRTPGAAPPPSSVLEPWVERHMTGVNVKSVAFLIARAIGRRGIPAHNMFRDTASSNGPKILSIFMRWIQSE